jgi:hypothetical protein
MLLMPMVVLVAWKMLFTHDDVWPLERTKRTLNAILKACEIKQLIPMNE